MSLIEVFKHIFQIIKANIKDYVVIISFLAFVIFSFMISYSSSDFVGVLLKDKFDQIGATSIKIKSLSTNNFDLSELTINDVDVLEKDGGTDIDSLYGVIQSSGHAKIGNYTVPVLINAVTSGIKNYEGIKVLPGGNFITDNDNIQQKEVVVVNDTFAEKYFKTKNIVGQTILLETDKSKLINYSIIGVIEDKKNIIWNPGREEVLSEVYIPVSGSQSLINKKYLDYIEIKVKNLSVIDTVSQRVTKLLEFDKRRADNGIFIAEKSTEIINSRDEVAKLFNIVVVNMGIISLIIGITGLSIFMTKVVKLKTREIAVRKMIGASNNDIFNQIISETVLISAIGGICGIILGIIFTLLLSAYYDYTVVNFSNYFVTIFVSIIVGIVAGFFPANKAKKIKISSYS